MSALTFSWSSQNLTPRQCRGCGRFTDGWGGKPGVIGIDLKPGDQYALCPSCGGKCCGDCKPGCCEFGIEGGSPLAYDPEAS